MADNAAIRGSALPVAADDVGGRLFQWVKLGHGDDGAFVPVSEREQLPVRQISQATMPPRALQYARDAFDRMRVSVDAFGAPLLGGVAHIGFTSLSYGANAAYPSLYGAGSPNSMDARERQRELSMQTFFDRRSRWVIT